MLFIAAAKLLVAFCRESTSTTLFVLKAFIDLFEVLLKDPETRSLKVDV